MRSLSVTDYRHCAETQDHHLEGSKIASTPPYILIADQYCLQITVPISVTYYPIMSYYLHLLRVYIEALELHSQSSRPFNSSHCKAYILDLFTFKFKGKGPTRYMPLIFTIYIGK